MNYVITRCRDISRCQSKVGQKTYFIGKSCQKIGMNHLGENICSSVISVLVHSSHFKIPFSFQNKILKCEKYKMTGISVTIVSQEFVCGALFSRLQKSVTVRAVQRGMKRAPKCGTVFKMFRDNSANKIGCFDPIGF